jgi:hypothetical protein
VAPVLQEYVVAPAAVNVAVDPEQMEGEFTVMLGNGFTVTVATAVLEHPFVVPVTVYDLVLLGETVIGFEVDPVLQE